MLPFILAFVLLLSSAQAEMPILPSAEPQELVVNNRILTKVNGKTISVIDVMKKMDFIISRHYPQLVDSKIGRFQFYEGNWKETLNQMVNTELMLADAETLEIKIHDGEVRETMIEKFGTSIMTALDKLGLTYEEARKIVYSDMVVQRMSWFRVHSKALQKINPKDIKEAYKDYLAKNPPSDEWEYQTLSIRAEVDDISHALAKKALTLLSQDHGSFDTIISKLQEEQPTAQLSLSPEYCLSTNKISKAHHEILSRLDVGAFSGPIYQTSRADNKGVVRIFHLKKHTKITPPGFNKLAEELHEQLVDGAVNVENELYINKLRQRFNFDAKQLEESIPANFHPFALL